MLQQPWAATTSICIPATVIYMSMMFHLASMLFNAMTFLAIGVSLAGKSNLTLLITKSTIEQKGRREFFRNSARRQSSLSLVLLSIG